MEREFSEIKKNAEELVENIEALNKEVVSFKEAKESLERVASSIAETCDSLSVMVSNSSEILNEVRSFSVEKTLKELKNSANFMQSASEKIIQSNDSAVSEMLSSNRDAIFEILSLNKEIMARLEKKHRFMAAVAVLCSVLSIVIALMR